MHHEVLLVEARWKVTVMAGTEVISFTFSLQINERPHMGIGDGIEEKALGRMAVQARLSLGLVQ